MRDKKTGKTKGFGFIGYEDQRSTILAVDNLNGIKVCHRVQWDKDMIWRYDEIGIWDRDMSGYNGISVCHSLMG